MPVHCMGDINFAYAYNDAHAYSFHESLGLNNNQHCFFLKKLTLLVTLHLHAEKKHQNWYTYTRVLLILH